MIDDLGRLWSAIGGTIKRHMVDRQTAAPEKIELHAVDVTRMLLSLAAVTLRFTIASRGDVEVITERHFVELARIAYRRAKPARQLSLRLSARGEA